MRFIHHRPEDPRLSLQIQRLVPDDVEQYRALMLEAYDRHPQAFTSSVREREKLPLAWWAARLDGELDILLGAFCQGRLQGIVGLAFDLREKARHKATLFGLYVTAGQRNGGLGQRLVQSLLAEAGEYEGLRLVQLTVTAGNDAALSLYQRCGFVQYGLEPLAVRVGDDYFDKIHMWYALPTQA